MRPEIFRGSIPAGLFVMALAISSWCHAGVPKSRGAGMTCPMQASCAACARASGPAQTSPRASLRPIPAQSAIAETRVPEKSPVEIGRSLPASPRIVVGRPIYLVVRSLRL